MVGSATRDRSRREDEVDAGHLRAPSNKELAASRPNPQGEWGLLYSLQALTGLANRMLRPISLSGLVADSWYRLPRPASTSTRKTHSPLSRYILNAALDPATSLPSSQASETGTDCPLASVSVPTRWDGWNRPPVLWTAHDHQSRVAPAGACPPKPWRRGVESSVRPLRPQGTRRSGWTGHSTSKGLFLKQPGQV